MLQSSLLLFNWASWNKNILTFNNVTNLGRDSGNRLPTQRATTLTGEEEGMKSETNNICSLPKMLCFRILPKNPILVTQIVQSSKTNKQTINKSLTDGLSVHYLYPCTQASTSVACTIAPGHPQA